MGCQIKRSAWIWIWIAVTVLGITAIAVGAYFSFNTCSAGNIAKIDCILPLSSCGIGGIAFILVGIGLKCLPARTKRDSSKKEVAGNEDRENEETEEEESQGHDDKPHGTLSKQFDLFLQLASEHPEILRPIAKFLIKLADLKK
nr:expressed protein [Hymenolepis microstoma]